jgi:DNA-binding response OmpR family regulator
MTARVLVVDDVFPVIIVTALDQPSDKVRGLGADARHRLFQFGQ